MNIIQIQERLKDVSDNDLVNEMQSPSGSAPQYLVLSELQRRKRMRDEFQRQQSSEMPTVAEEMVAAAGVPQGGIMQMAGAMAPKSSMAQDTGVNNMTPTPATRAPQEPMRMAEGGVVKMQRGGPMVRATAGMDMYDYMADPAIRALANQNNMSIEEYVNSLSPEMRRILLDTVHRATPSPLPEPWNIDSAPTAALRPSNMPELGINRVMPPVDFDATAPSVPGALARPDTSGMAGLSTAPSPTLSPSIALAAGSPPSRPSGIQGVSADVGSFTAPAGAMTPSRAGFAPYMEAPSAASGRPMMGAAATASDVLRDPAFVMMAQRSGVSPDELWASLSEDDKARQIERVQAQVSAVPSDEMPPAGAAMPTQADLDRSYRDEMLGMATGLNQPPAPQGIAGLPSIPGGASLPGRGTPPAALSAPGMETPPPFTAMTPEQREYFDTLTPEQKANVLKSGTPTIDYVPKKDDDSGYMTLGEAIAKFRSIEQSAPNMMDVLSGREEVSSMRDLFMGRPDIDEQRQARTRAYEPYVSPEEQVAPPGLALPGVGPMEDEILRVGETPELSLPEITEEPTPAATTTADTGGGAGGAGGAGAGGGYGKIESRIEKMLADKEKRAESDKWLALAQAGMALMASKQPTLGGALGEAGLVGISQLRESQAQSEDDILSLLEQQRQIASSRAAAARSDRAPAMSATEKSGYLRAATDALDKVSEIERALSTGKDDGYGGIIPYSDEEKTVLIDQLTRYRSLANMYSGLANPALANIQAAQ